MCRFLGGMDTGALWKVYGSHLDLCVTLFEQQQVKEGTEAGKVHPREHQIRQL